MESNAGRKNDIPGATLDQGLSSRARWKLAGTGLLQALGRQGPGQRPSARTTLLCEECEVS